MAKAKKATMEATPATEAVPTEHVELAAPAGLDLAADDLGFGTLREPEAPYTLGDVTPASDTAEDAAPTETPENPDAPEVPEESASAAIADDIPESAPAHPYEDKPETTNRCPYCNLRLALVPPNMVNPETGRTYYRQSCPSCPYVERVDEATKRVYHVEWPIHK